MRVEGEGGGDQEIPGGQRLWWEEAAGTEGSKQKRGAEAREREQSKARQSAGAELRSGAS